MTTSIRDVINLLTGLPEYRDRIVHTSVFPSASLPAGNDFDRIDASPDSLHEKISALISEKHNVLLSGESPSGKTGSLHSAVIDGLRDNAGGTALYIFATRALVRNQERLFREYAGGRLFAGDVHALDGGTERSGRREIFRTARVIMTTPDMLHAFVLPGHVKWADFLSRLAFVCIDDVHTYRGTWGTQCALVFRRLSRILERYHCHPVYCAASRPVESALEHASLVTGRQFSLLQCEQKGRGPQHVLFVSGGDSGSGLYGSPAHEDAGRLLALFVRREIKTCVFTRSWFAMEWAYRAAMDKLRETGEVNTGSIRAYRGGYLAGVREEVERELFSGRLTGIVTTNALEIGIHVAGLEACIITGYPGSVSAFRHMAGRAGRDGSESLLVFLGYNTPVNRYILNNPEYVLDPARERVIINPENVYALSGQLLCALHEMPMSAGEAESFGGGAAGILEILREERLVNLKKGTYYYTSGRLPARQINLRSLSRAGYRIVERKNGETIGYADEFSAQQLLHPGAVYFHGDTTYLSESLDTEKKEAVVFETNTDYYTEPVTECGVRTIDRVESVLRLPGGEICFGEVTVHFEIHGYKKINSADGEIIHEEELDLPPMELETTALWISAGSSPVQEAALNGEETSMYSILRGAGHTLQLATALAGYCSPLDVRDSYGWDCRSPIEPLTVFIFDNYTGGLGFAEAAFQAGANFIEGCIKIIKQCPCKTGCPSCVGYQVRPFVTGDPGRREGGIPKKALIQGWFELMLEARPENLHRTHKEEEINENGSGIQLPGITKEGLKRKLLRNKER